MKRERVITSTPEVTDFINLAPQLQGMTQKRETKLVISQNTPLRVGVECYKGIPTTTCSACQDNDGQLYCLCDPRILKIALEFMFKIIIG